MSNSPVNGQELRAAAEVHRELGPDYGDAVIESFLAKLDQQIGARVDERLAELTKPRRQPTDPARLAKMRLALTGAAAGSVLVGAPLTIIAWRAPAGFGTSGRLAYIWVALAVVYGLAAYSLRRRR